MDSKQITVLGLIAGVALIFAVFGQHQTLPRAQLPQQVSSSNPIEKLSSNAQSTSTPQSSPRPTFRYLTPELSIGTQNKQDQSTAAAVAIQLSEPDGTSNFEVSLNPGDDLCDNLVEAKAEGKIRSLLIDDSYLETFGSRYVREINGYSNNWTVEVNGVKPLGCSLYEPKIGEQIVWKFGE